VQRHQDPRSEGGQREGRRTLDAVEVPLGVERDALSSRRLGLELCAVSKLRGRIGELLALVNMDGVEDMAGLGAKPQLLGHRKSLNAEDNGSAGGENGIKHRGEYVFGTAASAASYSGQSSM
jgi:hypothetical protein